jgi:hypothetical protein
MGTMVCKGWCHGPIRLRLKDASVYSGSSALGVCHRAQGVSGATRSTSPAIQDVCVHQTSLYPNSSWTVRISYPSSSRWVAKECRNVCGLAGLVILAFSTASLTAFCLREYIDKKSRPTRYTEYYFNSGMTRSANSRMFFSAIACGMPPK